MIRVIPFGEIKEDRFEEGKKYNLLEMTAGIWRFTTKCKDSYEPLSYMRYLQGRIERENVQKVSKKKQQQSVTENPPRKQITKQSEINQLLAL